MMLKFDIEIGLKDTENLPTFVREAVRAIVLRNNEILLLESERGDYKLPGGGVSNKETHEDALVREIKEETGYFDVQNIKEVGRVIEKKYDEIEDGRIFQMTSYYYTCDIFGEQSAQNLDEYEADLKFVPKWVDLEDAIKANETYIENNKGGLDWTERETLVLKSILDTRKNIM